MLSVKTTVESECENMREDIKKRIELIKNEKVPNGFKPTKVGIIPNEWEVLNLSSFLKENKELSNDINKYPLYSSSRKGLLRQSEYYVNKEAVETNLGYKIVPNGFVTYRHMSDDDIFFLNINNTGSDILVSSEYPVFITENMSLTFLIEHLNNMPRFRYFCRAQKMGGTRTRLYFSSLKKYKMPMPQLKEQQKIAEILNHCDKVITLKQQLIEEEQKRKQWLMQNFFDPNSSGISKALSGKWKKIKLGRNGKTYAGLSGKSAGDFGHGKPYIPYLNIFQNYVINDNCFDYVNIDQDEKQNKVLYGDILFTTSSETPKEVGMSAVYLGHNKELYLNSFSFGFRFNSFDEIHPLFAAYYFNSPYIKKMLYKLAQGSTRYNLSKSELLKQTICFPSNIDAQIEIANIVSASDEKIELLEQELFQWQQKKKSLMQLLLTGIVRVSV